jgi:hypothetical protein
MPRPSAGGVSVPIRSPTCAALNLRQTGLIVRPGKAFYTGTVERRVRAAAFREAVMRNDPLAFSVGSLLQKFKSFELWLVKAGLPGMLARLPVWLLSLHFCILISRKTMRIARLRRRIEHWLTTVQQFSGLESSQTEMLDLDHGMRDDIEVTKRGIATLGELCEEVGRLFVVIEFRSWLLECAQRRFHRVVEQTCIAATVLQQTLELHDSRALDLLRRQQSSQQAP